jgi:formylglycine-generating enzyme required for sulfatase activity
MTRRVAVGLASAGLVAALVGCDALLGTLNDRSGDGGAADAVKGSGSRSRESGTSSSSVSDAARGGSSSRGSTGGRDASLDSTVDGRHEASLVPDRGEDVTMRDGGHDGPHGDSRPHDAARDAAADGQPPSCAPGGPGMTTCPAATGTESCCASPEVEGGTYFRWYDETDAGIPGNPAADGGPVGEEAPASVSGFRLDKYLVTVGRFRQFVKAALLPDGGAGWRPAAGAGRHTHLHDGMGLVSGGTGATYEPGWNPMDDPNVDPTNTNLACDSRDGGPKPTAATWTPSVGDNKSESLPINCVTWAEAYAFCIWDGGFLPSVAEWEYAAAGGAEQRWYPWGGTVPGSSYAYAIAIATGTLFDCVYPAAEGGIGACDLGTGNIAPVGTTYDGAGRWGQFDLVGEVNEWQIDWFYNHPPVPCTDCAELMVSGPGRMTGGGAWNSSTHVLPTGAVPSAPTVRYSVNGFRCARVP